MPFKNKADYDVWNRRRYAKNIAAIQKLKSVPCMDCKTIYPHCVMDFDHVPERGKKKRNIACMTNRSVEAPTFQAELKKCDVVCANCHKIRTYKRMQSGVDKSGKSRVS